MLLTDIFAGLSVLALFILVAAWRARLRPSKNACCSASPLSPPRPTAQRSAVLLGLCCVGWIARPFLRGRISVCRTDCRAASPSSPARRCCCPTNFALSGTTGVDARRLRRRLRTDDAGWHRRAVSAAIIVRQQKLKLCPYRDRAAGHRRPVSVGQQHVQHARPLSGHERRDGLHRAAFAGRISGSGRPKAALTATAQQLVQVATGEGTNGWIGHTYGIIERYLPAQMKPMRAAHQQHWRFQFRRINRIHVPVALASMLLVAAICSATASGAGAFDDLTLLAGDGHVGPARQRLHLRRDIRPA